MGGGKLGVGLAGRAVELLHERSRCERICRRPSQVIDVQLESRERGDPVSFGWTESNWPLASKL